MNEKTMKEVADNRAADISSRMFAKIAAKFPLTQSERLWLSGLVVESTAEAMAEGVRTAQDFSEVVK